MRQTMGRRIDAMSDEERDRIITATDFNDGRDWWDPRTECGCLEGTAAGGSRVSDEARDGVARAYGAMARTGLFDSHTPLNWLLLCPWDIAPAAIRYPQAVARYGKAKVVRALKLRAAKGNRISLPEPAEAVEHAG